MCGRFALTHVAGFWARFAVPAQPALELVPRFNIAPTQDVPIIIRKSPNQAVMMRWGLVPFWAKDPKIGNRLINARAETVAAKPAFRANLKRRRCLIPATGFYEWRRSGAVKIPYYVHLKDDAFFAFAGIYDNWHSPEGTELLSFAIITTKANSLMKKIHDRMPVIVKKEDEDTWIKTGVLDEAELSRILREYPSRGMEVYRVSKAVNNPRNESEDLIKPEEP